MSKFVIVAESGADIPVEVRERYNIHIVPMHVIIGDETMDDGTVSGREVYERSPRTRRDAKDQRRHAARLRDHVRSLA